MTSSITSFSYHNPTAIEFGWGGAAGEGDPAFLHAKIATARFYADALLPQTSGLAQAVVHGGEPALALAADAF